MLTVVIVAFNRLDLLKRLLNSLEKAEYFGEKVRLVISIDNSGLLDVFNFAESYYWPFGEKLVFLHEVNLGLRNHVIYCGNLTSEYDKIIVIEDDLFVSPGFYKFAKDAIEFYEDDDKIAGISLYKHEFNFIAHRPFVPVNDGFDVFFIQMAQSWGQIWTNRKWRFFYEWYCNSKSKNLISEDFPRTISSWQESSWLKYQNKYLVETDRFFVYPHNSLTSNFSDPGTHLKDSTNIFQVPILIAPVLNYRFNNFNCSKSTYDIFFESLNLTDYFRDLDDSITVDLYNTKVKLNRFLLTTNIASKYKVIRSFGLRMRPHELNIIFNIAGSEIYLVDTFEKPDILLNNRKKWEINLFFYDTKIYLGRIHLRIGFLHLKQMINNYVLFIISKIWK